MIWFLPLAEVIAAVAAAYEDTLVTAVYCGGPLE